MDPTAVSSSLPGSVTSITRQPAGFGHPGHGGHDDDDDDPYRPYNFHPVLANPPSGLECLRPLDQVVLNQNIRACEVGFNVELANRYEIFSKANQPLFLAHEENSCCCLCCCGPQRSFEIALKDVNTQRDIVRFVRPFSCCGGCLPCCLCVLEVRSVTGEILGVVEQEWTCLEPHYVVKDAMDNELLRIEGPVVLCKCCQDIEFKVLSADGENEISTMTRKFRGHLSEMFTDASTFSIDFPMDMSTEMKATMIGAALLIDFMYFERNKN